MLLRHDGARRGLTFRLGTPDAGLALIRTFRREHAETIVVCFSSYFHVKDAQASAYEAGAHYAREKPVAWHELFAAIEEGVEAPPPDTTDHMLELDWVKLAHAKRVLARSEGNMASAARTLGMSRNGLAKMIAKLADDRDGDSDGGGGGRQPRRPSSSVSPRLTRAAARSERRVSCGAAR